MSDEKIFMTTKLDGYNTRFLSFNKDLDNPIVKDDFKTYYFYSDILQINKLSKLISNFIFDEKDNDNINNCRKSKRFNKSKNNKSTTIFPRYHQLECVNLLLEQFKVGDKYLIQHSAGSGKTNRLLITWIN